MTHMTYMPGYSGYMRLFQTEHVSGREVKAEKHNDLSELPSSLMRTNPYASTYSVATSKKALLDRYTEIRKQESTLLRSGHTVMGTADNPLNADIARITPKRPVVWSSTYKDSIGASSLSRSAPGSASKDAQNYRTESLPQMLSSIPFANNLLRSSTDWNTSYLRDFGAKGHRPLQRAHALNDRLSCTGKLGIAEMATTNQLFDGTTKGSIRLPGYAGHIPASQNNAYAVNGIQLDTKNNLQEIYRHDMPGYTGHHPESVVNDHGPRTPRGKKRMNEGLVAGLILESMKVN